jgi:hypothetical protein
MLPREVSNQPESGRMIKPLPARRGAAEVLISRMAPTLARYRL